MALRLFRCCLTSVCLSSTALNTQLLRRSTSLIVNSVTAGNTQLEASSNNHSKMEDTVDTTTMNAIIYTLNKPKMIRKPIPTLKRNGGHILVRIHAAGVNPVDAKNLYGDKLPNGICQQFVKYSVRSSCPGFDFSGVVQQIPPNAAEEFPYRVGDKVYGTAPPFVGTFCEYQIIPLDQVQHMPSSLTYVEAAALPLTGLTCLQSLGFLASRSANNNDDTSNNQHLLVIGASGGTGHFAIQLAKRYLCVNRVVGICSTSNLKWVKETLGADCAIDYKDEQWREDIKKEVEAFGPFTCVLDTVFSNQSKDQSEGYGAFLRSESSGDSKKLLDGIYLLLGGTFSSWFAAGLKRTFGINLFRKGNELFWVRFPQSSGELDILRKAVDENNIKPFIHEILPFTEESVSSAFDALKSRRVRGKIVLSLVPE